MVLLSTRGDAEFVANIGVILIQKPLYRFCFDVHATKTFYLCIARSMKVETARRCAERVLLDFVV